MIGYIPEPGITFERLKTMDGIELEALDIHALPTPNGKIRGAGRENTVEDKS